MFKEKTLVKRRVILTGIVLFGDECAKRLRFLVKKIFLGKSFKAVPSDVEKRHFLVKHSKKSNDHTLIIKK